MKEAVQQFIVSRARDVFVARGFAGATVEEIAQAAGVSKPTLYNYFAGKQSLFLAVLDDVHARMAEQIEPCARDTESPFPLRLRRMAENIARSFYQEQGLVRIMLSERRLIAELLHEDDLNPETIKGRFIHGEIFHAMSVFFRLARERGEYGGRADPEILAAMYLGMMGQISMQQVLNNWSEEYFMAAVATVVDVIVYGLNGMTSRAGHDEPDCGKRGG